MWYKTRIPSVLALPVQVIEATFRLIDRWHHDDTAAPWWRLYWNDRAGWVARLRGTRQELGPGRVVLIAPETNFLARSEGPAGHFWVHFTVGPPLHGVRGRIFDLPADPLLARGVADCRAALDEGDTVRTGLRVPALCAMALARLAPLPQQADERIERVVVALREAALPYAAPIRNSELARRIAMHPNAFIRWFKRELGTTPQAFQTSQRIERACALLRYTQRSVQEIGEELGFCDRFHFSRTFRRVRGTSPAAFRRGGI